MSPSKNLSDAMIENFPWTTETIVKELGMEISSFRTWKNKMEKEGKLTAPKVPSTLCINDPDAKNRKLYSDEYMKRLRALREGTAKRNKRGTSVSALKHSALTLQVPIFDKAIAELMLNKFGSKESAEAHLRDVVRDIASPALGQIEQLKQQFEESMARILKGE